MYVQAERRIEREVARRLEVIGADETQWPPAAKDSLAGLSKKLAAMHDVMTRLQNELDSGQHSLAIEQAAKQNLQVITHSLSVQAFAPPFLSPSRLLDTKMLA